MPCSHYNFGNPRWRVSGEKTPYIESYYNVCAQIVCLTSMSIHWNSSRALRVESICCSIRTFHSIVIGIEEKRPFYMSTPQLSTYILITDYILFIEMMRRNSILFCSSVISTNMLAVYYVKK